MAEESTAPKQEQANDRKTGIQAYHDAKTPKERAEVLKKYGFLSEIFSEINHVTQ